MDALIKRPLSSTQPDQLCINTIRFLSVDAVQKANSGHPGLPMGAAPMAYVLWTKFLKHNPSNANWFNRDRFILSAGHGSMLLYSLLHLTGYDLPLEELKLFRQWGSKTPGHPERGITPGVEVTTGPLGQGFANGVGIAMAEEYLAAKYNKPGYEIVNHFTYGIVSDGDMMEGIASEAASLAGHLKLGKLIYLYDCNHITLAASTQLTFTEDYAKRFEAYGWHTQSVDEGNDLAAIESSIRNAQEETDRPSLIIVRTHIGYGSPNKQNTVAAHGSPLGEDEVKLAKKNLGWPEEPAFLIPEESLEYFREAIPNGKRMEDEWEKLFREYQKEFPEDAYAFNALTHGKVSPVWDKDIPFFPADEKGMATRVASGKVMQAFYKNLPGFIGGSADLNSSTHTVLEDEGNFEHVSMAKGDLQGAEEGGWNYAGRNLQFGVREHAMAGISNGLAAHGGILPYCATFLVFSDYMRPSIRLAAISELHVIYVFTHDSIGLGEDGTTHQPIEHLVSLRAIPRLVVIRPCDANETAEAWRAAVSHWHTPVALILTRQDVPTLDRKKYFAATGLRFGAYILSDAPKNQPELILIASGSEVQLIVKAKEELEKNNIAVRLVSMPSWKLFEEQTLAYQHSVLPPDIKMRIVVEAGSSLGWERYAGEEGKMICIDTFGSSAPGKVAMREYGFNADHICECALQLLNKT